MQITIKRGENPNAIDVLNALSNWAFYPDGSPWEATRDQVKGLVAIFGKGPDDIPEDMLDDLINDLLEGR